MAKRATDLTAEEIEAEIDSMKAEGGKTEKWMSDFSHKHMGMVAKKDAALRNAYQAGYRVASDRNFLMWLIYGAAAFSAGALFEFIVVSAPA